MSEYVRVVTFEADEAALDALVSEIDSAGGPPEGVAATRISVLADREDGKVLVVVRFGSEEALRKGAEVFEAMSPPDAGSIKRISVHAYEIVLERSA